MLQMNKRGKLRYLIHSALAASLSIPMLAQAQAPASTDPARRVPSPCSTADAVSDAGAATPRSPQPAAARAREAAR